MGGARGRTWSGPRAAGRTAWMPCRGRRSARAADRARGPVNRRAAAVTRQRSVAAMIDHFGINCADLEASARFYDATLGVLGHRRLMDVGVAIGYGTDKPDFWISGGEAASGPNREVHVGVHRRQRRHGAPVVRHGPRAAAPSHCTSRGCGRSTTRPTSAPSCATPTATTSRPCATAATAEPVARRRPLARPAPRRARRRRRRRPTSGDRRRSRRPPAGVDRDPGDGGAEGARRSVMNEPCQPIASPRPRPARSGWPGRSSP